MNLKLGDQVLVIDGPFSSFHGIVKEVKGVKGDKVTIEIELFGRKIPVELGMVQLFPSLNRGEWLHERLRGEIEREAEKVIDEALTDFWRSDKVPLGTSSEQWRAYERLKAELEMTHFVIRDERLQAMERTISKLPSDLEYPDILDYVADERAEWTPYLTALGRRFDDAKAKAKAGDMSAMDQYTQMNASYREAWWYAWDVEVAAWREANMPSDEELARRREAARQEVAAQRDEWQQLVYERLGIILPEHVYTFWAFFLALTPNERQAMQEVGIFPAGILDWFDPEQANKPLQPNLDHRLYYRYYRDPSAFFTILFGGGDGQHFGLWVDDPAQPPTLIAEYYNNDGVPLGCYGPQTLLEVVRKQLEWYEGCFEPPYTPDDPDDRTPRIYLTVLREAIMAWETADRPEQGSTYTKRYKFDDSNRLMTMGSPGLLLPDPLRDDLPVRDDNKIYHAIRNDEPIVQKWIADAHNLCQNGQPATALALGHELHWLSAGKKEREDAATSLLVAAYTALGYDALVEVAKWHGKYRDLWSVDVYEG